MRNLLCILLILFAMTSLGAQQFGYCNSELIISFMPETKEANEKITSLKTELQSQEEEMVEFVQVEFNRLQNLASGGCLSPSGHEKVKMQIQKMIDDIALFEQNMSLTLLNLETKLKKPILAKLNYAIEVVKEENGLDIIFDQGPNIILFAEQSMDITSLVKSKLGI